MKNCKTTHGSRGRRRGQIMPLAAVLLVVMLGMVAVSVDIGWMLLTRTQLQAASDAGSLAGGTELLPGLGATAYKKPSEVKLAAEAQAKLFTEVHRAGNVPRIFIDPPRDVDLGKASMDSATGVWSFQEGVTPFNAVRVRTLRHKIGTTNRDGPLPYFIAGIIGQGPGDLSAESFAVILPTNGISIPPGSGLSSGLSPFAYLEKTWDKYRAARTKYKELMAGNGPNPSAITTDIMYYDKGGNPIYDANGNHEMLFYEWVPKGSSGTYEPRDLFTDNMGLDDPAVHTADNINLIADGILEANIYPIDSTSGNFGTVDIGGLDNSTADLSRQIRDGVSEQDLAGYTDNTLDPSTGNLSLQGDTGVSVGLKHALEDVMGQCKTILLYDTVNNPGNNAMYHITEMLGIRYMKVDFSGSNKVLVIQPCSVSEPAGVPDFDEEIGEDTTTFTPLILAQ